MNWRRALLLRQAALSFIETDFTAFVNAAYSFISS
jgi:hypothetical protein